jgi:hypothetical protein
MSITPACLGRVGRDDAVAQLCPLQQLTRRRGLLREHGERKTHVRAKDREAHALNVLRRVDTVVHVTSSQCIFSTRSFPRGSRDEDERYGLARPDLRIVYSWHTATV